MKYEAILCISDLHLPYEHPDAFKFLKAVHKKYVSMHKYAVVIGGDEVDWHSISFHDKDADLLSPGFELEESRKRAKTLFKMFPKAFVLESNHGSLVYRKMKHHGLPRFLTKSYREIIGAPTGWKWSFDLTLETTSGSVYFHHGKISDVTKLSKAMSANAVQFHYHEKFKIEYWQSPNGTKWSMQCGCLIDDTSYAFAYNKNNLHTPILGVGIIIKGEPRLIRMKLNKKGRWTGVL